MKYLSLLLFIGFCQYFSAQVYTYQNSTKKQYEIINAENSELKDRIYQAAFDYGKFDELRFLDKRREVKIEGTEVTVILYSAQELLDSYGKKISPFTILPGQEYQDARIKFADTKHPEFVVLFQDK